MNNVKISAKSERYNLEGEYVTVKTKDIVECLEDTYKMNDRNEMLMIKIKEMESDNNEIKNIDKDKTVIIKKYRIMNKWYENENKELRKKIIELEEKQNNVMKIIESFNSSQVNEFAKYIINRHNIHTYEQQ